MARGKTSRTTDEDDSERSGSGCESDGRKSSVSWSHSKYDPFESDVEKEWYEYTDEDEEVEQGVEVKDTAISAVREEEMNISGDKEEEKKESVVKEDEKKESVEKVDELRKKKRKVGDGGKPAVIIISDDEEGAK